MHLVGPDARDDTLEIMLARGDRIRVPAAVPVETLRRVIQLLRTEC